MFLFLTSLDQLHDWRDFACQFADLEQAFDFLDIISRQGSTVVSAWITDQESVLQLPVEAFDGQPVGEPVRQIKQEWERILAQPAGQPVLTSPDDLRLRLQRVRQTKEATLRRTLDITRRLWQTAQATMPESEHKQRLLHHYQATIDRVVISLDRLQEQSTVHHI